MWKRLWATGFASELIRDWSPDQRTLPDLPFMLPRKVFIFTGAGLGERQDSKDTTNPEMVHMKRGFSTL
jgi:hypothetical protein